MKLEIFEILTFKIIALSLCMVSEKCLSYVDETAEASVIARLAVHNANMVPTLLYDSKTWVLQKKSERKTIAVISSKDIRSQLS